MPSLGLRYHQHQPDFQVAVGGVHRLIEHALEFKLGDFSFNGFDVLANGFNRFPVFFGHGELKKLCCIIDARGQAVKAADDIVKHLLFFADFLGMLRIIPEIRVFNLAVDFF